MIVVHDDVALNGSGSSTGPRGLAGTVFIHKIVGAAAFAGSDDSGRIGHSALTLVQR
jgi:dihydroxyacetone kinase-like protein